MATTMQRGGLALLLAATALAAADGTPPGVYYHFQNITKAGDFETGHMRGNPGHWVSRHERQEGPTNRGHVRWYGEGSSGLRVWDLGHVGHPEHPGHPGHAAERAAPPSGAPGPSGPSGPSGPAQPRPHRKSGGGGGGHPDCFLQRLQERRGQRHRQRRRVHATLITRDCAGNPLEPPGVRLSPGPPRPRLQPRAPTPPPSLEPWRQSAPAQPPAPGITDVFLQTNKRVGLATALDPPRGFEASAEEEDQEVQEDHLRGMKHADKPLMFGDGSYHATPATLKRLKQKLKLPMQIKGTVLQGPMKGPITIKVAPVAMASVLRPRPALGLGMGRVKPMVVLVRPMSTNRMPQPGKGPVNASKPVHLAQWLASMWKGG